MKSVFEIKNINLNFRSFSGEDLRVVDDVSFSLAKGEILGIAGESGCGKSTLMWGCMNICRPPLYIHSGDVILNGKSLKTFNSATLRSDVYGRQISLIPQGAINALNPTRKIKHLAKDMISAHDNQKNKKETMELLFERFTFLGMNARRVLDSYPFTLSGGMRQRVVIGISTLLNPQLVIADEPTSALDVTTQYAVIDLLLRLVQDGIIGSMIFITHELLLLLKIATRTSVMYAGEFIETGKTEQVLYNPQHPYSKALMASTGMSNDSTCSLPGTPPNLKDRPSGCRFSPRCPQARKQCFAETQILRNKYDTEVRCAYV